MTAASRPEDKLIAGRNQVSCWQVGWKNAKEGCLATRELRTFSRLRPEKRPVDDGDMKRSPEHSENSCRRSPPLTSFPPIIPRPGGRQAVVAKCGPVLDPLGALGRRLEDPQYRQEGPDS